MALIDFKPDEVRLTYGCLFALVLCNGDFFSTFHASPGKMAFNNVPENNTTVTRIYCE